MRYLEEQGIGYRTRTRHLVPIVPAAIVFDLAVGDAARRPDEAMGYAAAAAASDSPVDQGSVGAGTGCRVAALLGNAYASKGGVGSAAVYLDDGLIVAALVVVNAVGEVLDERGDILAGLRDDGDGFRSILPAFRQIMRQHAAPPVQSGENTVIGVVATNARLTKTHATKVAEMAHDGLARAVRPAHTPFDGDTFFALATGQVDADLLMVGAYGAEVVAEAIRRAVRTASTIADVRAISDGL
jgi:L-aminopeptidase/D-esterase-like protein